jgi:calcineurin-like phosphoesterase
MRFAFFGDVVGKSGRDGLADHLPDLRRQLGLEFVIINAENAAAGFGITENTARELFEAGADCLTLGNHSWDQREALTYIVREPRLIRPANYPILSDAPGRGSHLFQTDSGRRSSSSTCWAASTWTPWTTRSPPPTASWTRPRWARWPTP